MEIIDGKIRNVSSDLNIFPCLVARERGYFYSWKGRKINSNNLEDIFFFCKSRTILYLLKHFISI